MAHTEETRIGSTAALPRPNAASHGRFPIRWEQWLSWSVAIGLLLGWEYSAAQGWISRLFFPAPSAIAHTLLAQLANGELLSACMATLFRLVCGLLLGGGLGLLLGLLLGWSAQLRRFFEPWVAACHPIPKIAILPLFIILFGIGETSKIMVIAASAFFPMLVNTLAGVQQIPPSYFDVARNYGASRHMLFIRVLVPGSLPSLLTGLRLALNTALLLTIAVELISAKDGLGAIVWMAWQTLRISELYVALLVTALLGLSIAVLCGYLEKWLLPWQDR